MFDGVTNWTFSFDPAVYNGWALLESPDGVSYLVYDTSGYGSPITYPGVSGYYYKALQSDVDFGINYPPDSNIIILP